MTNYCPHKSIAPSRWLMTFALVVWSSLSYAQMRTEDIYDRGERRRDIPATGIIDPDAPVDSIGGGNWGSLLGVHRKVWVLGKL